MLPSRIGNRDHRPGRFLQDLQFFVEGKTPATPNARINRKTLCIRRHSRMTRLTLASIYNSTVRSKWGLLQLAL